MCLKSDKFCQTTDELTVLMDNLRKQVSKEHYLDAVEYVYDVKANLLAAVEEMLNNDLSTFDKVSKLERLNYTAVKAMPVYPGQVSQCT